jgi:hypothetical protein
MYIYAIAEPYTKPWGTSPINYQKAKPTQSNCHCFGNCNLEDN